MLVSCTKPVEIQGSGRINRFRNLVHSQKWSNSSHQSSRTSKQVGVSLSLLSASNEGVRWVKHAIIVLCSTIEDWKSVGPGLPPQSSVVGSIPNASICSCATHLKPWAQFVSN